MARANLNHFRRFLLGLALALLACAVPGALQPTTRPATPAAVAPTTVAGAIPRGAVAPATAPFAGEAIAGVADRLPSTNAFAPFRAASVGSALDPALPREDLRDMAKLQALLQLTDAQQEALLDQGFFVDPRPFDTFAAAYAYGAEQKLPAFITADAILHAFRIVAGVAWQRAQSGYLAADLQALSHNMVLVSQQQWEAAADDATAQAALRNLAFFAIGSSLIDPGFTAPSPVSQVVAEELTLIAQGGRFISPLFGVEEEYDRFRLFGHYAQDDALGRYFRALAWYSRPFSLSYAPVGNDTLEPVARARFSARQALLIAWGLRESNNFTRWQRIFEPTLFFEGASAAANAAANAAWSIAHVQAVSDVIYGPSPALPDLAGDALVDDFLATMHTMPALLPFDLQTQPTFALLPAPSARGENVPDAAAIRQLTYNRIGAYTGEEPLPRTAVQTSIGAIRGLPRTLDVAAAFGSTLAAAEVAATGDDAYEGYALQLDQLQQHYAALESNAWATSYDGGWLFALQPLLTVPGEEGFLYAPIAAWQARQLAAWQAGWLGLRHETVLTPRSVAAVTISPEVAYGYLEPHPMLYARLAALAGQIVEGLGSRDLLDGESSIKLQQLEQLLEAARDIARRQLAGRRPSAEEALLLSQFMTRLQNLITYRPAPGSAVPLTENSLLRLADVYLEPSSGRLLQAAGGAAWPIYVLIPREQGVILTMGAIHSSYELHGEQLSVDAWRALENRPPPPSWLQPYVVPSPILDN